MARAHELRSQASDLHRLVRNTAEQAAQTIADARLARDEAAVRMTAIAEAPSQRGPAVSNNAQTQAALSALVIEAFTHQISHYPQGCTTMQITGI
jgi:hypothetical protein